MTPFRLPRREKKNRHRFKASVISTQHHYVANFTTLQNTPTNRLRALLYYIPLTVYCLLKICNSLPTTICQCIPRTHYLVV